MSELITPREVLEHVARSIPEVVRDDIIIVGSLAASYQLLPDVQQAIRTKDVDGMLAPHARAMVSASRVTDQLLTDGWVPENSGNFEIPGTAATSDDRLSVVRLHPPGVNSWFLELLGAPPSVTPVEGTSGRGTSRIVTIGGHFELPSFSYLGLVQFRPTLSEYKIRIALPEMMALANLLHHPTIQPQTMRSLVKDSGRTCRNKLPNHTLWQWLEQCSLPKISAAYDPCIPIMKIVGSDRLAR
ncbi:MAG: hypothetical protein V4858_22225 [Pseudomonadota bacterium]